MKVICAWHWPQPVVIGEKCPACGEMAKRMPLFSMAVCWNRDCEVLLFKLDDGAPASHGICEDCAKLGRVELDHPERALWGNFHGLGRRRN